MAGGYITGTNHSATLAQAMNDFDKALTRRWREKVCTEVVADTHDYPTVIRRSASAPSHESLWPYWSLPARHHFVLGGCAYVDWVKGGQNGPLSAVRCDGATGARRDTEIFDLEMKRMVTVPPYIECGMGQVLGVVDSWAWGERDEVFYRLPMFDHHNLAELKNAHDTYIRMGSQLGLEPGPGSSGDVAGRFEPMHERELPAIVENISSKDADGQDWWAGWTGLAARRAGAGFFASVAPTLNNQSGLLGALANLYSDRAAIIEKGRNDALYWIQWATGALGAEELVTTSRTDGWKVVQGIGAGVTFVAAWTGAGGAIGAGVTLVGFLGENLDPGARTEEYVHGIEEVVGRLNDEIRNLGEEIDRLEVEYLAAVTHLRNVIFGIHSYNLELYDLTQNDAEGDREGSESGYTAEVSSILRLAESTFHAGEMYEGLLPTIAGAADADRHLADKDGSQTASDTAVIEARDQLEQFLKTTCGRYLVAAEQVRDAAQAYAETDESQRESFDRTIRDWEREGVGKIGVDFDPKRYAEETDRSGYDPYEGHPALGGGRPGAGDGEEYVTEAQT